MASKQPSPIEARHAALAEQASQNIQTLYDELKLDGPPSSKIRFPRGVIRTSESQRKRFSFISDPTLRTNCAYNIALADIQNWILCRTDITGLGRRLVLKSQFILLSSIVESATKNILKGICGKDFKGRLNFLAFHKVIDSQTENTLCAVWDIRTNIHLFMMDVSELQEPQYSDTMLVKGVSAFRKLIEILNTQHAEIRSLNNYVTPVGTSKHSIAHQANITITASAPKASSRAKKSSSLSTSKHIATQTAPPSKQPSKKTADTPKPKRKIPFGDFPPKGSSR